MGMAAPYSATGATAVISGLLQLAVACYALRLNRLFGTRCVGWSLFSAFALLALLHVVASVAPSWTSIDLGINADAVCALVSVLLLIGIAHLEAMLTERSRLPELTKANEQLRRMAASLQAEIAERNRLQQKMEKTHQQLMTASRQAGMSEVATGVLHNVGNVLNSVNVSANLVADHLAQSKIVNISRIARMMAEHTADLGGFITRDPRGRQLPEYLGELGQHLEEEQQLLLKEIDFVKQKIDHIKEIVATQQSYGRVSGMTEKVKIADLVDDVLQIHADELAQHRVQLRRQYDPGLPEIIVDKHKVLQILLNLISNAKHACLESGREEKRVIVQVTGEGDRARIVVSDNGVGIPVVNLNRIFNHGFTTRKLGGHGFGLHSGALAAKEMGGVLTAESEGLGKGATFTLELPLQPKLPKN
jgi:signal transduction histidine kinase